MYTNKSIYISGPIFEIGKKNFNKTIFNTAEYTFRRMGYKNVFNPLKSKNSLKIQKELLEDICSTFGPIDEYTYKNLNCIVENIEYLIQKTTTIYMLKEWEKSKGSVAEHALAVALDLEIIYQ